MPAALPPPTTSLASQLPANSDTVQIDTANLSQEDMRRLRNARVVDLRSLSGRPLTEEEARALTARMQAGNMAVSTNTKRPLYLPPDEYFTRVGDADLVCMNTSNQLVSAQRSVLPRSSPQVAQPQGARRHEQQLLYAGSDIRQTSTDLARRPNTNAPLHAGRFSFLAPPIRVPHDIRLLP